MTIDPRASDKYAIHPCASYSVKRPASQNSQCREVVELDKNTRSGMHTVYDALHICDAPRCFNVNQMSTYPCYFVSDTMPQLLYIKYGPMIIPGIWFLDVKQETFVKRVGFPIIKFNGKQRDPVLDVESIHDIVKYVKTSKYVVHCICISVRMPGACIGHSLVLVIYVSKDDGMVHVLLINPHMDMEEGKYDTLVLDTLAKMAKDSFIVDGLLTDRDISMMYQGANRVVPVTSFDFEGYCQTWVMLMMETIVKGFTRPGPTNAKGIARMLKLPIKPQPEVAWRKLVLDYLFSRLIELYVITRIINLKAVSEILKHDLISKYIDNVDVGYLAHDIYKQAPDVNDFSLRIKKQKWSSSIQRMKTIAKIALLYMQDRLPRKTGTVNWWKLVLPSV